MTKRKAKNLPKGHGVLLEAIDTALAFPIKKPEGSQIRAGAWTSDDFDGALPDEMEDPSLGESDDNWACGTLEVDF